MVCDLDLGSLNPHALASYLTLSVASTLMDAQWLPHVASRPGSLCWSWGSMPAARCGEDALFSTNSALARQSGYDLRKAEGSQGDKDPCGLFRCIERWITSCRLLLPPLPLAGTIYNRIPAWHLVSPCHVPGTVGSIFMWIISLNLHSSPWNGHFYYSHFTEVETEAHSGY